MVWLRVRCAISVCPCRASSVWSGRITRGPEYRDGKGVAGQVSADHTAVHGFGRTGSRTRPARDAVGIGGREDRLARPELPFGIGARGCPSRAKPCELMVLSLPIEGAELGGPGEPTDVLPVQLDVRTLGSL